jgi:DNA-binding NarL/FixJ family response regulator
MYASSSTSPRANRSPVTKLEQRLSVAERAVLEHILAGARNIAIAKRLGRSDKTVKNHLAHIFAKTGTTSRLDLTVRIYKARIRMLTAQVRQQGRGSRQPAA